MVWETRERRAHARVQASGFVIVHTASGIARGRLRDLSGRAMYVEVTADASIGVDAWDRVETELHLDGEDQRWFRVSGQVARIHRGCDLVIEFEAAPHDLDDLVQDVVVAALETARTTPHAVVVDPDPIRRRACAAALRAAGCVVRQEIASVDVVAGFEDEEPVIAIADTIPEETADGLRRFLAAVSPAAELVVVDALSALRHVSESE